MKYDYNNLKEDILIGREIEFSYNGNKYSISNNKKGFFLTKFEEDYSTFNTIEELLDKATIDGIKLDEIFKSGNVKDITIF